MLPKIENSTFNTLKYKYTSSVERNNKESQEFFKFLGKLHFNNFFIDQKSFYYDIPWDNKYENSIT